MERFLIKRKAPAAEQSEDSSESEEDMQSEEGSESEEGSASDEGESDDASDKICSSKRPRTYEQKPRAAWFKDKRLKNWILQTGDILTCKYCHCKLKPKLHGLLRHAKTSKHLTAVGPFVSGKQALIKLQSANSKMHIAELSDSLYVAVHSSIRVVDHLTGVQSHIFPDSVIAQNLTLRRTKCSAVIKNVLFPYFKKILMDDMAGSKFSLIVDEATDITIKKYVGIVVRYYSTKNKAIVNTFLKLAELDNCTANGIVLAITNTMKEYKLSFKDMVGLGTDNASVMVGINNGVIAQLKELNPDIKLIPCICHSIQLAVSAASASMPNEIEFIVSETYNWFSKSVSRQKHYESLFSAINDGLEPLKITRACDTRWLSVEPAIKRIVEQWFELKTHFGIASLRESCYKAKILSKMYNDENLAYLQFLKPILYEVQKVNKLFESNVADPTKLFSEVAHLLSSLCNFVASPSDSFDPLTSDVTKVLISRPYFHYTFEEYMRKKKEDKCIDDYTEEKIRHICRDFVIKLIEQLRQRLPQNIETLRKIDFFSVESTLTPNLLTRI